MGQNIKPTRARGPIVGSKIDLLSFDVANNDEIVAQLSSKKGFLPQRKTWFLLEGRPSLMVI